MENSSAIPNLAYPYGSVQRTNAQDSCSGPEAEQVGAE